MYTSRLDVKISATSVPEASLPQTWLRIYRHLLRFLRLAWIQRKTSKVGSFRSDMSLPKLMNVAERVISQEEKKPGFSVSLLQIVAAEKYGGVARLASALYFKNFIKRNWTVSLFETLEAVFTWLTSWSRTKMETTSCLKMKLLRSSQSLLGS